MSWGPFCLQVGRREAGREAEAPFRHSASWWAEWGRGYSCVDSHKSLTMWLGQRAREGSRGRSFLSLGVWVLGGEQHRVLGGGWLWILTLPGIPGREQEDGQNGLAERSWRGRGPGPSTEPTRTVPPVAPLGGPGPSSQPLPRWRGAAPPPRPGAASPSPPPPPTPRCSCCRRPILHVANGGAAQGKPRVRARGSPGPRGRGSGGVRACAASASRSALARARQAPERAICPRAAAGLVMLGGSHQPLFQGPSAHATSFPASATSTQAP